MKFSRIFFSVMIGVIASFFLALTFFHFIDIPSIIDRLFLTLIPAFAFSLLLYETFPAISAWTVRIRSQFSIPYSLISFLFSFILTSGFVGFFHEVLRTPFGMILFASISLTIGNIVGYYLVKRAVDSFHSGFLHKQLNLVLVLSLPILWVVIIFAASQFPSMFIWSDILVPQEWMALFIITSLFAWICSLAILEKIETRGLYQQFQHTKAYQFISQNLLGFYAGGMFFLINLILARTLNHPALSYNTVLFEADAGPWMKILASPESASINRSVHPLSLIIIRPLVRFVSGLMGDHYQLGGMLVVAFMAALCVFMAWLFVKRATDSKAYAFLFSILLGSTATHLLFGSLTENYIFGAAALIFFFLLIQSGEKRFSVLVPAGLLLFGITITNIAQGVIGLFFNKFGFRRLLQYLVLVISLGVLLTVSTSILYPQAETLFFVPNDLAFEFNFVKSAQPTPITTRLVEKFQVLSRTMFLYEAVGPKPLEVVSDKPPFSTIDIKTYDVRTGELSPYKGISKLPLVLWLILLAGALAMFAKNFRSSKHTPLMLGLLGALGFNFLMHMVYGTELFLYTPYWMYALVFFIALALSEFAERSWLQVGLTLFVFMLMANNVWFLFTIFRGLAPFYAATP